MPQPLAAGSLAAQTAQLSAMDRPGRQAALLTISQTQGNHHVQRLVANLSGPTSGGKGLAKPIGLAEEEQQAGGKEATGKSGGRETPVRQGGESGGSPAPDKVQAADDKKDEACSKTPKLSHKTVQGPTAGSCGGYSWTVQWTLDKPSCTGGWIIQKLEFNEAILKCKGNKKTKTGFAKWVPYWEAWPVKKGQKVTTYAEGGDVMDDTYSLGELAETKGQVVEKGTAAFHEGLKLPSGFKADPSSPAGILPMTKSDPGVGSGTGAIDHTLKASWDCCKNDQKTKIET